MYVGLVLCRLYTLDSLCEAHGIDLEEEGVLQKVPTQLPILGPVVQLPRRLQPLQLQQSQLTLLKPPQPPILKPPQQTTL